MKPGAQRVGWTKLSPVDQADFDRLCITRGFQPAAKLLGISAIVVDRLFGGGTAKEDTVERVRHGLEQVRTGVVR